MTTVDAEALTVPRPPTTDAPSWLASALEHHDAVAARVDTMRPRIQWGRLFLAILTAIPYLAGKCAGLVVTVGLYAAAGVAEGYRAGRGTVGGWSGRRTDD